MLTLLHAVSYVTAVAVFAFVTLSLASGLLWLAEIIEEHSRTAKIFGKRAVYAVIVFHFLLYFVDSNLPLKHTLFSVACHFVYLLNFRTFPVISLTSWSFVVSCLMVIVDHFLWFFHFHEVSEATRRRERRWRHPMEPVPHVPTFLDIATFFGICIWMIPLFLFLSLTANENALPTTRNDPSTPGPRNIDGFRPSPSKTQRSSLFVSLSSKAISLFPVRRVPRGRSRGDSDGIIAPRSNSRPSSPLQPGFNLLSPSFQRRSTSPGAGPRSSSLIPPGSPLHSPIDSPTSVSFGTGSWIPVDEGSHPSSRPTTPGALGNLGTDSSGTRRRANMQAVPPRRSFSHTN